MPGGRAERPEKRRTDEKKKILRRYRKERKEEKTKEERHRRRHAIDSPEKVKTTSLETGFRKISSHWTQKERDNARCVEEKIERAKGTFATRRWLLPRKGGEGRGSVGRQIKSPREEKR